MVDSKEFSTSEGGKTESPYPPAGSGEHTTPQTQPTTAPQPSTDTTRAPSVPEPQPGGPEPSGAQSSSSAE